MTAARISSRFRRPSAPVSAPGHLNVFTIRLRRPVADTFAEWLSGHRLIFIAEVI